MVKKLKVPRKDRLEWLKQIKSVPCMDCGVEYPPFVMDLDHRDRRDKRFSITHAVYNNRSFDSILEEVAKCDIVCANCHRIRTYGKA